MKFQSSKINKRLLDPVSPYLMQTKVSDTRYTRIAHSQNAVESSILRTLVYFDIFHYPLTDEEIFQFLDQSLTKETLEGELRQMIDRRTVFFHGGFYCLQDNPLLVHRRKEGNQRAQELLPKAMRIGRFLYYF